VSPADPATPREENVNGDFLSARRRITGRAGEEWEEILCCARDRLLPWRAPAVTAARGPCHRAGIGVVLMGEPPGQQPSDADALAIDPEGALRAVETRHMNSGNILLVLGCERSLETAAGSIRRGRPSARLHPEEQE
jgi:hypothetical protein